MNILSKLWKSRIRFRKKNSIAIRRWILFTELQRLFKVIVDNVTLDGNIKNTMFAVQDKKSDLVIGLKLRDDLEEDVFDYHLPQQGIIEINDDPDGDWIYREVKIDAERVLGTENVDIQGLKGKDLKADCPSNSITVKIKDSNIKIYYDNGFITIKDHTGLLIWSSMLQGVELRYRQKYAQYKDKLFDMKWKSDKELRVQMFPNYDEGDDK